MFNAFFSLKNILFQISHLDQNTSIEILRSTRAKIIAKNLFLAFNQTQTVNKLYLYGVSKNLDKIVTLLTFDFFSMLIIHKIIKHLDSKLN